MAKLSRQIEVNKKGLSEKFLRAIDFGLEGILLGLDIFYDFMWGDWRRMYPSQLIKQSEQTDIFDRYAFREITAEDFAAWNEADDGSVNHSMKISKEMLDRIAAIDKKCLLQQFNQTDIKENNKSAEFEI